MADSTRFKSSRSLSREQLGPDEIAVRSDSVLDRISTLHEIAVGIDAATASQEVMSVLNRDVRWIVPHEVAFICLADRFRTHYAVRLISDPRLDLSLEGTVLALAEGTPGVVIEQQTPLQFDLNQPGADGFSGKIGELEIRLREVGMSSYLVVPLRHGDATIGAMGFAAPSSSAFHDTDIVLAQLLATQVAVAVETMRRLEEAQKRIAQIELVNEVAEDLTSTLDLEELMHAAAETIRRAFNYLDVSIFLIDKQKSEAFLVSRAGIHDDFIPRDYRQSTGTGILGWAALNNQRVIVNDVSADPRYIHHTYTETRSEMAIPIRVEHETVGILNVEDVRLHAFDETDAVVLETLCDQIGSAIKNAQLFERLKRSNAKLTELDRMKTDFLGIVSHDFRSPLASIVLAAKALIRRPDQADGQRLTEYLQVIIDQATKLINLAEDTLSVTKLESGKLNYMFNMVNLERLVKDAAAMVNLSKRHTWKYEIDPDVAFVKGDQSKLRQVLQNLISNAVKYSPNGGEVILRATDYSADHLVVSVKDAGIGIPEDQIGKLFQKFARVESDETKEIRGSGLGLWICREIVRAHGGIIWVESTPGAGSTFSFTLKKGNPGPAGE
jgi:K+-sensing histidine kinase KdpD